MEVEQDVVALTGTQLTCTFIAACVFYPGLYWSVTRILDTWIGRNLTRADITTIAERFVSTTHAVIAVWCGYNIVSTCATNTMRDRHWMTDAFACFSTPYFYYDCVAMYHTYVARHSDNLMHSSPMIYRYLCSQPLMMVHHIGFPLIFFPAIVFLRNGAGDFYVGCFYLIELAIPFISIRAILYQLKMEGSFIYAVNGIMLIVTWTICRVLIFPFMFHVYGSNYNISAWIVPFHIPKKCTCGCLGLLLFQLYWLKVMFMLAYKTIRNHWRSKKHSAKDRGSNEKTGFNDGIPNHAHDKLR